MFLKIEMCRKKGHVCEDDEINSWGSWRIGYSLLEFIIKVFHHVFSRKKRMREEEPGTREKGGRRGRRVGGRGSGGGEEMA